MYYVPNSYVLLLPEFYAICNYPFTFISQYGFKFYDNCFVMAPIPAFGKKH